MIFFARRYATFFLFWVLALIFFHLALASIDTIPRSVIASLGQTVVLLLLLLIVRKLLICGRFIPTVVLLIALAFTIFSTLREFGFIGIPAGALLVSRQANDPEEKQSRIFREALLRLRQDYAYGKSDAGIVRFYGYINSEEQANNLLRRNREVAGVLWAKDRWWVLSWPVTPAIEIGTVSTGSSLGKLSGFKAIANISAIGFSKKPEDASARFIVNLAEVFSPLPLTDRSSGKGSFKMQEIALLAAGTQRAFWTSSAHLAYPWFILGNLYLEDLLINGYQSGKAKCAASAYRNGLSLLRSRHDNPELCLALFNNNAALLVLRAVYEGKYLLFKKARRYLRSGLKAGQYKGPFEGWRDQAAVVSSNLLMLQKGSHLMMMKRVSNGKNIKRLNKTAVVRGRKASNERN